MKKTIIFLLIVLMLMTAGCGAEKTVVYNKETDSADNGPVREYSKDKPLFALAETEEEARKIADDYGIEFVEFSYGVASFNTDKDLGELIEWGKEQGLPLLEINYITHID